MTSGKAQTRPQPEIYSVVLCSLQEIGSLLPDWDSASKPLAISFLQIVVLPYRDPVSNHDG